ncbi:hypothetical protein GCM10028805_54520 [Spirosoma harenae]
MSEAQNRLDRNLIITTPIYNDAFGSINPSAEITISNYLKGKSLSDLVNAVIIDRTDINMRDFALPLGVFTNVNPISFQQGMKDMWSYKKRNYLARDPNLQIDIDTVAARADQAVSAYLTTMDLNTYRDKVLKPAIDSLRVYHQQLQPKYSPDRRLFMDIIVEQLSANMLLCYNIHEMLPPWYFSKETGRVAVNPIFKIYYFDRILQEAGCEFISYFPARNDTQLSFGPYQFTNTALEGIWHNKRLSNSFRVFTTTKELKTTEQHALAAVLLAYHNWEMLSMSLKNANLLTSFNEQFQFANFDMQRNLRIFMAGITACMHHMPAPARRIFVNRMGNNGNLSSMHMDWIKKEDDAQLYKVYHSSAEVYLFLKVYDKLFSK